MMMHQRDKYTFLLQTHVYILILLHRLEQVGRGSRFLEHLVVPLIQADSCKNASGMLDDSQAFAALALQETHQDGYLEGGQKKMKEPVSLTVRTRHQDDSGINTYQHPP